MINLKNAFLEIINEAGQTVLINDVERIAVITNPPISEYEQRNIHTLETVYMGDTVEIDGEKYLTITESIGKRGFKYKVIVRHCNYVIEVAGETIRVPLVDENGNPILDDFGDPIYEYIEGEPVSVPVIVDNKSFSVDGMSAIRLADNQIQVIMQDNEFNRGKFVGNYHFNVMGSNWTVNNQDLTKKGLLILTCES